MSDIPDNDTYTVPPWQYELTPAQKRGAFDGYPCAICGKAIPTAQANKHGGIITTSGEWTTDPDHPDSQGWHPVGSGCHRKFKVRR